MWGVIAPVGALLGWRAWFWSSFAGVESRTLRKGKLFGCCWFMIMCELKVGDEFFVSRFDCVAAYG